MTKTSPSRILIVEDEAIIARDISLQLARSGYERVGVVARGEDAVDMVGTLKPDLVLMDIQLAGALDGIAAATMIREQHQVPVVFLTAFADEAVLERARKAEPFGYIVKPFEERELQPAIEIALHKHRTEAALRRSEERFRRLFNGVRDALLLADPTSGRILEANDEACRLFRRTRDDLIGMHQGELHPAAGLETYARHFRDHAAGSAEVLTDAEIVTSDGTIIPVEVNAGPVELGDRAAVLGVFRDVSARRAAEQAVRDRQGRLDAIFRAAPVGIGVVIDRVFTEVNDWVSSMTGYAREELLGRSSRILYRDDAEYERVGRDKYAQIRTHGTGNLETCWQRKDGQVIDVLMSSTPVRPGDLAAGVVFTAVDITEPKRIKSELAQRNRVLEGLHRISQIMLGAARDDEAFSRIAAEIAGITEMRFAAVLLHHPGARTLQLAGLHGFPEQVRAMKEIPVRNTLSGLVLETGSAVVESDVAALLHQLHPTLRAMHPHAFAGVPLRLADRVIGVLAVAHDQPRAMETFLVEQLHSIAAHIATLVERREARAAQRRSETELLAIYDHAPVIICLLDEHARIIRANETAARFAGRSVNELHGARGGEFLSCIHSLDDSRGCGFGPDCADCPLRTTIRDTLTTGRSHSQVEVQKTVTRSGTSRELSMLLSTARLDLDGRQRILIVLEDITENRRLTEQLMRAQRMESIGTLASGIAHDLNNVLAPIVMCLSMLRDLLADPAMREMVDTMQLAANRGADIVRQLLTFARGLGGDRVEIQLKHVIQETARIARETFPRSIEVNCDYGRDLQTVVGDPTQIQQVLMNLCVNARDAMPKGGRLTIRADNAPTLPPDVMPPPAQSEHPFIAITVADTGIGMPPAVLERIFDPFFTTKPVGKGTGLGLAVSLGIIERHEGHIRVVSRPGQGTTFQVFLPQANDRQEPRPPARSDEHLPQGSGETILVVDDEPGVRTVIVGMLERAGYRAAVARDGGEALARLQELQGRVQILITDIMMPGMDGLELIAQLRQRYPTTPMIAMTGLGEDDVRSAARDMGAERVLTKPFSHTTLLWAVHELLVRHGGATSSRPT